MSISRPQFLVTAAILLSVALVISGIHPYDRTTWLLEVFPVIIALPILATTYRRFLLTTLLYLGMLIHGLVLITGGVYSYARVPLGFQLADFFNLSRNPYDRIGHFFQGFVPALLAREILIRSHRIQGARTITFLTICIVLAISSMYEIFEWATALILGQGATEFLGTQGDAWDTQSDMLCALIGAISATLFFSGTHDRQIETLSSSRRNS